MLSHVPSIPYDDAPLRLFHVRVAAASTGGVFADGFGLGIIGISLTLAAPQLGLSAVWLGLVGAGSLAGLFAGALLTGPVADRFGRRFIFSYNMVIAAALSILQYWVPSGIQLLLLRVAIGFILGTDYVVSKALLTEFVPRRLRGRILGYSLSRGLAATLVPMGWASRSLRRMGTDGARCFWRVRLPASASFLCALGCLSRRCGLLIMGTRNKRRVWWLGT